MNIHYCDEAVTLYHGDCREVLASLPDASVDSVVTDPPYGLEFMGKDWDRPWAVSARAGVGYEGRNELTLPSHRDNRNPNCRTCKGRARGKNRCTCTLPNWDRHPKEDMLAFQLWCTEWAAEALRVLKPGGHLLAFGGTRTWHRLAVAIEDAGFEIRDSIAWMYGSGFPKSLDVSKAIQKSIEAKPAPDLTLEYRFTAWARSTGVTARLMNEATDSNMGGHYLTSASQPAIPTRAMLEQMRHLFDDVPAWVERVVDQREREKEEARIRQQQSRFLDTLALKNEPVVPTLSDAARWQGWGTALKPAHEPIVVARKPLIGTVAANVLEHGTGGLNIDGCRIGTEVVQVNTYNGRGPFGDSQVVQDYGSKVVAGRWPANVVLDEDQAAALDEQSGTFKGQVGMRQTSSNLTFGVGHDREKQTFDHGLTDFGGASRFFYVAKAPARERPKVDGVAHPTVKPLTLMRWLCRLVTPPGGVILEPFAGSGTTVQAAVAEGFRCIAIEREDDYLPLILSRLTPDEQEPDDGQLTLDASA